METFSLVLNSANSVNRNGSNLQSYTYNIDWDRVIPVKHKYRKFNLTWVFRSDLQTALLNQTCIVYCDLGQMNLYSQNGGSFTMLGAFTPYQYTTATAYYGYASNMEEQSIITVSYPQNRVVPVTLTTIGGASVSNFTTNNYVLQLYFELIPE